MAEIVEITDINAPELDMFARLTESQLRSRREPEKGIFIAESPKVIRVALDAGLEPVALLMEGRHLEGDGREIVARCPQVPVYTGSRELLSGLTGYTLTRGVLCAMRRPAPKAALDILSNARRVAVLEGVVDATNIGAIFRSAAALGLDGVLLSPTCCDPLIRRAARVSMGTVFQIPWAYLEDWPTGGLELLRERGFKAAAMALTDDSVPVDDPCPAGEPRLAIVLGTEGDGLAPSTVAACDYTVKIPMYRGVDSLNVSAAAAVAFWALSAPRQTPHAAQ